ncbi:uncharacterized protein LOC62_07G009022 [Vanrija pseudolonga]|uniref:Uncharacterized protein n=1 Tax=Vanrija pseudolonga TaxID=143232 RepID=A0AAF0YEV6_9TREE|nr:hypothetical protein LOC62_07G009022 [Vanrija pseudolonga]
MLCFALLCFALCTPGLPARAPRRNRDETTDRLPYRSSTGRSSKAPSVDLSWLLAPQPAGMAEDPTLAATRRLGTNRAREARNPGFVRVDIGDVGQSQKDRSAISPEMIL